MLIRDIADVYGVTASTIYKMIAEIGEPFGELRKYRFAHWKTSGRDPWQQNMLHTAMLDKGLIAPIATDDEWSVTRMHIEWGRATEQSVLP